MTCTIQKVSRKKVGHRVVQNRSVNMDFHHRKSLHAMISRQGWAATLRLAQRNRNNVLHIEHAGSTKTLLRATDR